MFGIFLLVVVYSKILPVIWEWVLPEIVPMLKLDIPSPVLESFMFNFIQILDPSSEFKAPEKEIL